MRGQKGKVCRERNRLQVLQCSHILSHGVVLSRSNSLFPLLPFHSTPPLRPSASPFFQPRAPLFTPHPSLTTTSLVSPTHQTPPFLKPFLTEPRCSCVPARNQTEIICQMIYVPLVRLWSPMPETEDGRFPEPLPEVRFYNDLCPIGGIAVKVIYLSFTHHCNFKTHLYIDGTYLLK